MGTIFSELGRGEVNSFVFVPKTIPNAYERGFGKHKDKTFAEIYLLDPGYIAWCRQQPSPSTQMQRLLEYAAYRDAVG